MAKEESKVNFNTIMSGLKAGRYAPIYFLMGEEPYFIDKISDYIESNILTDDQKDMNLRILYGKDVKMEDILLEARQYPFASDRRIVIVKEAQSLKRNIDKIELYLKAPVMSTILVFCYKYEKLDGRKKYIKDIERLGVLFQTPTIYDNQIPEWIIRYCSDEGLQIDRKAASMLANNIGNDLTRIASEIDKLKIILADKGNAITPDLVETNVGISKEYNNFELVAALRRKNTEQVFRIVDYFGKSPKSFVVQVTLATIFKFFADLLYYQLLRDKSSAVVAKRLGINPYFVTDYAEASRLYPIQKIQRIIGYIRHTDAKSKGFGSVNTAPEDLLKELCYKILY